MDHLNSSKSPDLVSFLDAPLERRTAATLAEAESTLSEAESLAQELESELRASHAREEEHEPLSRNGDAFGGGGGGSDSLSSSRLVHGTNDDVYDPFQDSPTRLGKNDISFGGGDNTFIIEEELPSMPSNTSPRLGSKIFSRSHRGSKTPLPTHGPPNHAFSHGSHPRTYWGGGDNNKHQQENLHPTGPDDLVDEQLNFVERSVPFMPEEKYADRVRRLRRRRMLIIVSVLVLLVVIVASAVSASKGGGGGGNEEDKDVDKAAAGGGNQNEDTGGFFDDEDNPKDTTTTMSSPVWTPVTPKPTNEPPPPPSPSPTPKPTTTAPPPPPPPTTPNPTTASVETTPKPTIDGASAGTWTPVLPPIPTPAPHISGTPSPTQIHPSHTAHPNKPFKEWLGEHLSSDYLIPLNDDSSPQTYAFSWLESHYTQFSPDEVIQRYALGCFYYSTYGQIHPVRGDLTRWISKEHWLSLTIPECQWFGITCRDDGRVIRLDLVKNGLGGKLVPELELLKFLESLDVRDNNLYMSMSELKFVGHMDLRGLYLGHNDLYNDPDEPVIPSDWDDLWELEEFELSSTWIDVFYNEDTNPYPKIPEIWTHMSNLRFVNISSTRLTGAFIPSSIMSLTKLETFVMENNNMKGELPFPEEDGKCQNLRIFHVGDNQLSGTIPTSIGSCPLLESLDLQQNILTNPLPTEIGKLHNLEKLDVSMNKLFGLIPTELGHIGTLDYLNFQNNSFIGDMPSQICGLVTDPTTNLGTINVDCDEVWCTCCAPKCPQPPPKPTVAPTPPPHESFKEYLTHHLPDEDMKLPLDVDNSPQFYAHNWLESHYTQYTPSKVLQRYALGTLYFATYGQVHPVTQQLTRWTDHSDWMVESSEECTWYGVECENGWVVQIDLSSNGLGGILPKEMILMPKLEYLNVHDNAIYMDVGDLSFFGEMNNLRGLLLGKNDITNTDGEDIIPSEFGKLEKLEEFEMSNTWLDIGYDKDENPTPTIPDVFGEMSHLRSIDISSTKLTGATIPTSLFDKSSLQTLIMNNNNLRGDLGFFNNKIDWPNLHTFDVHRNEMHGAIPAKIGLVTSLKNLDLRENSFHGPLPTELGELHDLESLLVSFNVLSGNVPSEIGTLEKLEVFEVQVNQIKGDMPEQICRLTEGQAILANLTSDCNSAGMNCECCDKCF